MSGFYIARLTPLYRFGSRGSRFARAQNSEWRARRKRRGRPLPTEDHCTAYAIALVWVGGGRRLEGEAWRTEKLDSDVRPTPVTPTVAPLNTYTFLKRRFIKRNDVLNNSRNSEMRNTARMWTNARMWPHHIPGCGLTHMLNFGNACKSESGEPKVTGRAAPSRCDRRRRRRTEGMREERAHPWAPYCTA